ncbi:esterase [Aliidiomarina minuta]|uniref:Esterase n=1 Tax=Aliidiomarina minuta TaxID=880057 RepID=A0A432W4C1_9GAMM|nr:alpha/beta hydrolase-fold protein [Aliidiomarina minuta]RUO24351.1 esterase [Aliidiomarina minuta]
MPKIWVFLVGIMLLSACQPQESVTPAGKEQQTLQHLPALQGDYFELESALLERSLHIYVRLPLGYDANETHYPIVYLLDGDSLFPILGANHLFLTYDDNLPEAIIVGIAYGSFEPEINKRGYDFTANAPDAREGQGGAAKFHDFLKRELIPEVEGRYRADSNQRVLFGQSLGGSMVLYSAYTDPDLFWGRIASNPVFAPGREMFFAEGEPATRTNLRLVVTSGSDDRPPLRAAALAWFDYVAAYENCEAE